MWTLTNLFCLSSACFSSLSFSMWSERSGTRAGNRSPRTRPIADRHSHRSFSSSPVIRQCPWKQKVKNYLIFCKASLRFSWTLFLMCLWFYRISQVWLTKRKLIWPGTKPNDEWMTSTNLSAPSGVTSHKRTTHFKHIWKANSSLATACYTTLDIIQTRSLLHSNLLEP